MLSHARLTEHASCFQLIVMRAQEAQIAGIAASVACNRFDVIDMQAVCLAAAPAIDAHVGTLTPIANEYGVPRFRRDGRPS